MCPLMLQASVRVRILDFFFSYIFFLAHSAAEGDAEAGFTLLSSRLQVTFTNICVCQSTARLVPPHYTAL